jgi:hypothetical protein
MRIERENAITREKRAAFNDDFRQEGTRSRRPLVELRPQVRFFSLCDKIGKQYLRPTRFGTLWGGSDSTSGGA